MKFFIVALFIQLSLFAYAQHHKSADLLTDITYSDPQRRISAGNAIA
jgi:hypothetical protein